MARADAGISPVQDPVRANDLYQGLEDGTFADTFPESWATSALEGAAEAAGTMPAISALGTIALGAVAFDAGWHIGRVIDTRWLHLSGDVGVRLSTTPEIVSWEWRTSFACNSSWTSASCQGPGFHLRTATYTYYCDPYAHPPISYWWGDTGCPYPKWLFDQMEAAPGTKHEITNTSSTGCGVTWGPCWVKELDSDAMRGLLVHSPPVPYTTQPYTYSTAIPAPSQSGPALDAARVVITTAGPPLEKAVNSGLDADHWSAPDSSGNGGGYNGGGSTTSASGGDCDLEDDVPDATWEMLITADPTTYADYCADAWAAVQSLGVFGASGEFEPGVLGASEVAIPGVYLQNEAVVEALTTDGSQMTDWAKMKSPQFETGHGLAELHWYQNLETGATYLGEDFKLVFTEIPG